MSHGLTPATQREPSNPSRRYDAARRRESEGLRLMVDVPPQRAPLSANGLGYQVNPHTPHRDQIDHQAIVADRMPRKAVPTAAHGDEQPVSRWQS